MNRMRRPLFWVVGLLVTVLPMTAAERVFDFSTNQPGKPPAGFKAFVVGGGKPADWQVVMASVPPLLAPVTDKATVNARVPALTQLSKDLTDERYPVIYSEGERYGDFTLTTRFRMVSGAAEQIAGVVFRLMDERNFCVVRASALGGNLRFYKFVDGQRTAPVGNDLPIEKGRWYELTVKAEGNKFDILLDGRQVIPTITDNSFRSGKVGFITKSDAVSEFAETKITFRPMVSFAETLAQQVLERQPRILNLKIYGKTPAQTNLHVLAAKDPADIGQPASDAEIGVLSGNETYYGKTDHQILVSAPLRDRNGEAVGVVKFFLKPFAGQTEANAVARVLPTVRWMEAQLAASEGLSE
ncbi:MAG: hypothetical protein U1G08_05980 [Verrucomicrobiota bacterium]